MVDEFLRIDPIYEAEKQFGKHHSQFNDAEQLESLRMGLVYNRMKQDLYKNRGDNWYGAPLSTTMGLLIDHGFRTILAVDGIGERAGDFLRVMEWKNKMLAVVESFMLSDAVNSGSIYAMAQMSEPDFNKVPGEFSGGWSEKDAAMAISYDIREGVKALLGKLSVLNLKEFPWEERQHICLITPGLESSDFWEYREIAKKAEEERLPILAKNLGVERIWGEKRFGGRK